MTNWGRIYPRICAYCGRRVSYGILLIATLAGFLFACSIGRIGTTRLSDLPDYPRGQGYVRLAGDFVHYGRLNGLIFVSPSGETLVDYDVADNESWRTRSKQLIGAQLLFFGPDGVLRRKLPTDKPFLTVVRVAHLLKTGEPDEVARILGNPKASYNAIRTVGGKTIVADCEILLFENVRSGGVTYDVIMLLLNKSTRQVSALRGYSSKPPFPEPASFDWPTAWPEYRGANDMERLFWEHLR